MASRPLFEVLKSHGPRPQPYLDPDPTTSKKEWARPFAISSWTVRPNDIPNFLSHFELLNEEDRVRFQCTSDELSHPTRPSNEADVDSFFDENCVVYNKKAYVRAPYISFPKHHGPGYKGAPNIFVDWAPRYMGEYVAVGEMKKPGVIRPEQWRRPEKAGSSTRDLAKELLATAYYYRCPRVWAYDSLNLLLLRWKGVRDNWRSSLPDCWVIPIIPELDHQVSVRLAIYMFLREGMHVIHGQKGQYPVLGTVRLCYDINSGIPKWYDGGQYRDDHPEGYEREFDPEKVLWYWTHESQPEDRFLEEHSFVQA